MVIAKLLGILLFLSAPSSVQAQLSTWKMGGSGLPWAGRDTVQVMIDFASAPGTIQPLVIALGSNIISLLDDWSFLRQPSELGYVDGERPRLWKWNEGNGDPTENGVALIDADSSTYNSSKAEGVEKQFFTIDFAVPMPANIFGFHTPSGGHRSDGTALHTDATPAFQISVQEETSDVFAIKGPLALEKIIAEPRENLIADVRIEFPRQYVRFFRWARKLSIADEEVLARCGSQSHSTGGVCAGQGNQARALLGTISEFEVYGEGVPKRVIYKSKITELGPEQNFGRLFFATTLLRLVEGVTVEAADARASVRIEVRTGRDDNPNIYHEYTVTGKEKEVSRERFENELRTGFARTCASCDFVQRAPRPGMRASIFYDSDNWTFWSLPITQSGLPLNLASGSHIQLKITLESEAFSDFVRLDSLWIETAPLLVGRILGEVAPLGNLQPARGVTEVSLGELVDFVYDVAASFSNVSQAGFDAVSIRTGTRPQFKALFVGGVAVEPAAVREDAGGLRVVLPERITRVNNAPLRLVFAAEVFELATTFLGEISDSQSATLPQPIVDGDASAELNTNSLRVLSTSGSAPRVVQDLRFSTPVLTPNGDGVHDELVVSYSLFGLPESVPVDLQIYALDGRRVATVAQGAQAAGAQIARWNGRDENGQVLPPGLYLLSIAVQSERSDVASLRPVGIAY